MNGRALVGSGLEGMMANEPATVTVAGLAAAGVVITVIVFASVAGGRDAIIAGWGISGGVAATIGRARTGMRL